MVCSPLGSLGGGKLYILGVVGYVTPTWDVLALEGEREEAAEHIDSPKLIKFLPKLGNRCQWGFLGLRFAPGLLGLHFLQLKMYT